MLDVVSAGCGIQAQVLSAAQMALHTRIPGLSATQINQALWHDRTLVKVWSMRGTLHLLPAAELPFYVAALRPYRLKQEQRWMTQYGVDEHAIEAMADAIVQALGDGHLTRRELSQAILPKLEKSAPPIGALLVHGWGGLGKYVCLQGNLCLGPNQGQEATFVRRDRWLADWQDIAGEEAESWLLRRYLAAYGPATVQDFAFWAGIRVSDARQIWERLDSELHTVAVAGASAAILERDLPELCESDPKVAEARLLPNFDVYLLAHRSKSHLVSESFYKRVYRAAGWVSPVVLVNGGVAGIWSHKRRGKRVQVSVEPFTRLTKVQREQIELQAASVAGFFESSLELTYTGAPA
jgi:hypothetical protein